MPYVTAIGPANLEIGAALGAEAWPWVAADADLLSLDPIATEGVQVSPAAADAEIAIDIVEVEVRLEQGAVHGAEVEVAEALVGLSDPGGWVSASIGRGHLPITYDVIELSSAAL